MNLQMNFQMSSFFFLFGIWQQDSIDNMFGSRFGNGSPRSDGVFVSCLVDTFYESFILNAWFDHFKDFSDVFSCVFE